MERKAAAFVLNVSTPNGVGVVRSLGREGIPVVAADNRRKAAGFSSKYVRPVVLPDPVARPNEALEALMEEGAELGEKGVLFPCSDAFVLFVSRFRRELSEHFSFRVPSEKILESMVNKRRQYDEAVRIGTPIAKTFYPTSMEEVEDVADVLDYPAFIKPYYSHIWYEKFGNKGFKVRSRQELVERFSVVLEAGIDALVQSIIQGPNTNHVKVCAYFDGEGRCRTLFLTRKIRQNPTEFGVGTIMKSFHDPGIARMGIRFFKGIGYMGIGSIEFKLDDRDGQYKMIELNPRLWLQNSQATYAGINFPLVQYMDLIGSPVSRWDYQDDVIWGDYFEDARSWWHYRRRGQTTVPDLARSWSNIDCHAYFAWDDMGPLFAHSQWGLGVMKLLVELMRQPGVARPAPHHGARHPVDNTL